MLARGPALGASPGAVSRVLHEAGYELEEAPTRPYPDKVRSFERAMPNQLWQTDLFTFVLKRQNRRVYLVAFMDDHSRFLVSFGLHASQSTALALEVLRAGITSYGAPREVLTDRHCPVCDLARQKRVHEGVGETGYPTGRGSPPTPADAGKDRALLGYVVAGVPGSGRVRGHDLADARASGSVTSSTGTTSDARTKASTIWRLPTDSSARRPTCCEHCAHRWPRTHWSWPATAYRGPRSM